MRTEQEMVAYALEIDPRLLPHVPELLADLEELGSDAEQIAEVIDGLDLPADATVVDLGCGKGAVAVEIADDLELSVLGIELFEPFIASCNALAAEYDVSQRCEFRCGNVLDMVPTVGQFDVAVFAALGDVLGAPDATVAAIRDYVKPGGYMIISDVLLVDGGSNQFPGFEHYHNHADTLALLTAHGDALVRELFAETAGEDDDEDDEAELIRRRAQGLAHRHPELKSALLDFAAEQAQENAFVDANFKDAIWVLKKS